MTSNNKLINEVISLPNVAAIKLLKACGQHTFPRVWLATMAAGSFAMIVNKLGIHFPSPSEKLLCFISMTVAVWFLSFGLITGVSVNWAKQDEVGHRVLFAIGSIFSSLGMLCLCGIFILLQSR